MYILNFGLDSALDNVTLLLLLLLLLFIFRFGNFAVTRL